ncbi:MAG: alpha-galactosidase, partial [Alkalibacterium sp.]|nr:alpha-galactosidase [Alkalibacterium sp.]
NITEAFSAKLPANRQKEFFHRYILGVYDLYDRLNAAFPYILFESCASGGARFDPGMLYYAPQTWTSDDTDAVERLKIQYGTSMVYPLSSIGSHVSAIPNHQVSRETPLKMRADVAYFGTFGYELDVTKLTPEEEHIVSEQIKFFKKNRELIQQGNFYRLENSEDGRYSWMVTSKDQKTAILASYKVWATPNPPLKKVLLQGLNSELNYHCEQRGLNFYGDELMHFGFLNEVEFTGLLQDNFEGEYNPGTDKGDFSSYVYTFEAK